MLSRIRFALLFVLLGGLSASHCLAQQGQARLDSLLAELPRARADTQHVMRLLLISFEYSVIDPTEGLRYADQGLRLAQRLRWMPGQVRAYNVMGANHLSKSDYPRALEAYLNALRLAEASRSKPLTATVALNLGNLYGSIADYPKALKYFQQALQLRRQLGNIRGATSILINIGETYRLQGQYARAIDHFRQALAFDQTLGQLAINLNNLGLAYLGQQDYPTALSYLGKGLQGYRATGDKAGTAEAYEALGRLYLEVASARRPEGLRLVGASGPAPALQKARAYADSARRLAADLGDLKQLALSEQTLSRVEEALGHTGGAFAAYRRYITTKEKAFNQESQNKLTVTAMQYEFDKKETTLRYRQALTTAQLERQTSQRNYLLGGLGGLVLLLGGLVWSYRRQQRANALLERQKAEIDRQRTKAEQALTDLKAAQAQLVQKERLASLGELTAGIAHEIQNPLNFVNNFSEVSSELVGELNEELDKQSLDRAYVSGLTSDLSQNLQKITLHGQRAASIVKGMLEHSRASTGEKQPTDLNALTEEYLRLAYHGFRAKDKAFNATLNTDFEPDLPKLDVVPQEMGRVLLNLFNNAFYAIAEKQRLSPNGYRPTVNVNTRRENGQLEIRVSDNGVGIPEAVKTKIFQPFFTTKPTGEGTGLGLSLSYDIVTKGHGGTLDVQSAEGEGTQLTIKLPL